MPSNCFSNNKNRFAEDVIFEESLGSTDGPKRILIVMDALKGFSVELLEWVLKNFRFRDCCSIILLGIMPWLNMPLSAKTWSEIWAMNLEDLSSFQDKNEFKNDPKYQKVQRLIDLCQQYGVVPEIRTEMGHPIRLLVVEEISSLHPTLVVFDRHHDRKYIEYYSEKIPCSMVVLNDNGEVDFIRKRKCDDSEVESTPQVSDSPPSVAPHAMSNISQHLKNCLKPKSRPKNEKDLN